jgi:DNA replication initiation complex subunit (GINS family)
MPTQEDIYQALHRAWKMEITGADLHKIPDANCFLKNIESIYQDSKKKYDSETKPIGKAILQKILFNIQYLLNDLLDVRADKILTAVNDQKKIDESLLLDIEIEYYHSISTAIRAFKRSKNVIINADDAALKEKIDDKIKTDNKNSAKALQQIEKSTNTMSLAQDSKYNYPLPENSIIQQESGNSQDISDQIQEVKLTAIEIPNQDSIKGSVLSIDQTNPKKPIRISKDTVNSSLSPSPYSTVVIVKDQTAIVGEDFEIYGPFREEDILFIPHRNAEILIEGKVAKKLNDVKI